MKVTIICSGGLVQEVYATAENVNVEVVDLDDDKMPDVSGLKAVY